MNEKHYWNECGIEIKPETAEKFENTSLLRASKLLYTPNLFQESDLRNPVLITDILKYSTELPRTESLKDTIERYALLGMMINS